MRRHVNNGVDAIKIYAATTMQAAVEMPADILAAIVSEAHQNGKLALAHPHNRRGLQNAIAGGVDVLVHTMPLAGPLTGEGRGDDEQADVVDSDAEAVDGRSCPRRSAARG